MLLTYGEHAHIPTKITTFYDQAYAALFSQHDARKSAFKRTRKTTLDINDFQKAFSVFCFITLQHGEISFSETNAIAYIKKSQELIGIYTKSEDFLDDLIQSVCLLVKDGLFITFTHRSFQEYFAASFIKNLQNRESQKKCIDHFASLPRSNNVLRLLWDLDSRIIDEFYILPGIKKLRNLLKIKKNIYKSHSIKLIKNLFDRIEVDMNGHTNCYYSLSQNGDYLGVTEFILFTHNVHFSENMQIPQFPAELLKEIKNKNSSEMSTYEIALRKIKLTDPLSDFISQDSYFGVKALKKLFELEEKIIEQYDALDIKLSNILEKSS